MDRLEHAMRCDLCRATLWTLEPRITQEAVLLGTL